MLVVRVCVTSRLSTTTLPPECDQEAACSQIWPHCAYIHRSGSWEGGGVAAYLENKLSKETFDIHMYLAQVVSVFLFSVYG